ncbi:MAG: cytochrome c oxidase subunit 4 [Zunongwangia sp.]|uniref:aa3-type cytochrome oxidase subunit IV n=1 Tax=Zunongwangia sp. TaxID=1965325 RepID=UPI0032422927
MMNQEKKYKAKPEELPRPTYWPFFLAFGIVFIFWGILTNWFLSGMGAIVFVVALIGWIVEINKEIKHDEE